MKKIIAIQGYKNSGKDTVSEMIQYLLNTPKWMHKYEFYNFLKIRNYKTNKYQIIRYADTIKETLSLLLNIPIGDFENREFKEYYYVDFNTLTVYAEWEIKDQTKILNDYKFAKEIKRLDMRLTREYYLSIRQILQYYGTEIMRHYFGDNIWILSVLKSGYNKIIIPDQRFINENRISRENNAFIIHIIRPGCKPGNHSSEFELQELEQNKLYDYLIDNNGSMKDLFNECKQCVKQYASNN